MMGARGDGKPDGYTNSGVYMQNRYEIQIESPKGKDIADPYNWKIGPHGIAAFCMDRVPDRNAWRPNGQWHAFHFIFKDAKWEGDKKVANAVATVWWNGIKVHDNNEVKKANGGIKVTSAPGGLKLQEHGQDVLLLKCLLDHRSELVEYLILIRITKMSPHCLVLLGIFLLKY